MRKTIRIPERGHTEISAQVWARLSREPVFQRLLDRGLFSVSYVSPDKMRLNGSSYVGRAVVDDFLLDFSEKIDGALSALLQHATLGAFRVERAAAPATDMGALAALLVTQFLLELRLYVSRGRERRYTTERCVGSLVGGRLVMSQSLALRARGMRHLLAFDRNVLTYSTLKNRVLTAALREIEQLAELVKLRDVDITASRSMGLLFADCRDHEVLFGRRELFAGYAERLLDQQVSDADQDLLALAAIILSHESFELSSWQDSDLPRAWFLNLENLFEKSIRRVWGRQVPPGLRVLRGSSDPAPIFSDANDQFSANPDLVITSGATVLAAGDVKYKNWEDAPTASDLYQLLVHAAAFNAPRCFLVYPGDRYEARKVGTAVTGADTWLFMLDVRDIAFGANAALTEMGVPNRGIMPLAPLLLPAGA